MKLHVELLRFTPRRIRHGTSVAAREMVSGQCPVSPVSG
jgi:hypothetical protein